MSEMKVLFITKRVIKLEKETKKKRIQNRKAKKKNEKTCIIG